MFYTCFTRFYITLNSYILIEVATVRLAWLYIHDSWIYILG